jgi:hypothetical protein
VEDHHVLGANSGERVEGHLWCAGRGCLGVGVRRRGPWRLEYCSSRDLGRLSILHIIIVEEVEEALAHVPPDIRLITVEAEALAAVLLLLGRG